jgi:hypothetical protein
LCLYEKLGTDLSVIGSQTKFNFIKSKIALTTGVKGLAFNGYLLYLEIMPLISSTLYIDSLRMWSFAFS